MKKYILPLLILFILASCDNYITFKATFADPGNLEKGSDVFVNDEIAGKVISVEQGEHKYTVTMGIADSYRKVITKGTAFYLVDKNTEARIVAVPGSLDNDLLEEGTTVKGKTEFEYSLRKGVDNLKNDVEMFFKSDEWNEFRQNFENDLNEALKKGNDQIEENLPGLKEKWNNFIEKMDEEFGDDMREKVLPFVDSLGNKLKDLEDKLKSEEE